MAPRNIFQGRLLSLWLVHLCFIFGWICGSGKALSWVTEDIKVILESVHLTSTLLNFSNKRNHSSKVGRSVSFQKFLTVCHFASKGYLFPVFVSLDFPYHLLTHWFIHREFMEFLSCTSRHCSVVVDGEKDWEPALLQLTFWEMGDQGSLEQKTKYICLGTTLFFLRLLKCKWLK